MRTLAKVFGYTGGLVVVIVAGQYAYATSDTPVSGAIWAFLYGFIAVGGLFGPALATRIWLYNRPASGFIWAVALASLTIAISNEVGAMAGRGSEQTAQRTQIADTVSDARRSLALAENERAGLTFTPADEVAVQAAQAKATAATKATGAECAQRGPKCQAKEAAESQALADLSEVTARKALTDRAAKLDAQIAALREKIEHAGPVRETNTQGRALARLFGLDDAEAAKLATRQNTAMMIVAELLIVALILAAEEIEKHEKRPATAIPQTVARREEPAPTVVIEHEEIEQPAASYDALESVGEAPRPMPVPMVIEQPDTGAPRLHSAVRRAAEAAEVTPQPLQAPTKPRLVASEAAPLGNVLEAMTQILEPGGARDRVALADLHAAYTVACQLKGKQPVLMAAFVEALAEICEKLGIATQAAGKDVFLLKVKLNQPAPVAVAE